MTKHGPNADQGVKGLRRADIIIFDRHERSPCWSLTHSRYRKVFHNHVFLLIIYVMNSTDITTIFQHAGQGPRWKWFMLLCFSIFSTWHTLTVHYLPWCKSHSDLTNSGARHTGTSNTLWVYLWSQWGPRGNTSKWIPRIIHSDIRLNLHLCRLFMFRLWLITILVYM